MGDWRVSTNKFRARSSIWHRAGAGHQEATGPDRRRSFEHPPELPRRPPKALVYVNSDPPDALAAASLTYQPDRRSTGAPRRQTDGRGGMGAAAAGRQLRLHRDLSAKPPCVVPTSSARPFGGSRLRCRHDQPRSATAKGLGDDDRWERWRRCSGSPTNAARGVRRQALTSTIPANVEGAARPVDVEPGRWLVEATLPSGEVISEEVAVRGAGKTFRSRCAPPSRSPHEWLGWQHLVGNIEGAETLRQIRGQRAGGRFWPRHAAKEQTGRWLAIAAEVAGASARSASPRWPDVVAKHRRPPIVQTSSRDHRGLLGARGLDGAPRAGSGGRSRLHAPRPCEASAEATWLYQITGRRSLTTRGSPMSTGSASVSRSRCRCPGRRLRDRPGGRSQMMVRMHPLEQEVHIGVVVQDPDFGTHGGADDRFDAAAGGDRRGPGARLAVRQDAASAGRGGGRLRSAGSRRNARTALARLDRESRRRFPDMPDGAILEASLRLRFPQDKSSADEARAAFSKPSTAAFPISPPASPGCSTG